MWELDFITEKDFTNHVKKTIGKYGEKLESYDLKKFNKNIIDPIKLVFDKTVYRSSWDDIVGSEILGRGINQIIMILDIFTNVYSSILRIAVFRPMAKMAVGM